MSNIEQELAPYGDLWQWEQDVERTGGFSDDSAQEAYDYDCTTCPSCGHRFYDIYGDHCDEETGMLLCEYQKFFIYPQPIGPEPANIQYDEPIGPGIEFDNLYPIWAKPHQGVENWPCGEEIPF